MYVLCVCVVVFFIYTRVFAGQDRPAPALEVALNQITKLTKRERSPRSTRFQLEISSLRYLEVVILINSQKVLHRAVEWMFRTVLPSKKDHLVYASSTRCETYCTLFVT